MDTGLKLTMPKTDSGLNLPSFKIVYEVL
jgi:hypothetical protein